MGDDFDFDDLNLDDIDLGELNLDEEDDSDEPGLGDLDAELDFELSEEEGSSDIDLTEAEVNDTPVDSETDDLGDIEFGDDFGTSEEEPLKTSETGIELDVDGEVDELYEASAATMEEFPPELNEDLLELEAEETSLSDDEDMTGTDFIDQEIESALWEDDPSSSEESTNPFEASLMGDPVELEQPASFQQTESAGPCPQAQQPLAQAEPHLGSFSGPPNGGTTEALGSNVLLNMSHDAVVEVGRTELTGAEISQLTYGSVIAIEKSVGEPVDLVLDGHRVAYGEVVKINNDQLGIRIIGVVND